MKLTDLGNEHQLMAELADYMKAKGVSQIDLPHAVNEFNKISSERPSWEPMCFRYFALGFIAASPAVPYDGSGAVETADDPSLAAGTDVPADPDRP